MNLRTVTAIHSCPRSGSTWLLNIFNSVPTTRCLYQPLFSYTHKNQLDEFSSAEQIEQCFWDFHNTTDSFALMTSDWFLDEYGSHRHPTFSKNAELPDLVFKHVRYHHLLSNMLARNSLLKVIGLIRDPRAAINSFLNSSEFKSEWNRLDEWRWARSKNQQRPEEFFGYERWKEAARVFAALADSYPNRFRLIRYIDLLANTRETVEGLFEFCNLEFGAATEIFIKDSQTRTSGEYGVHRVKSDDLAWQRQLEPDIAAAIETDIKKSENDDLRCFLCEA